MGIFDAHQGLQPRIKDETASVILEYKKCYMELLRAYKPEIDSIMHMLKELRDEEDMFWKQLHEIEESMINDEVVSADAKKKWLEQYHDSMAASFRMSREIIQHYIVDNENEFEEKLKYAIQRV